MNAVDDADAIVLASPVYVFPQQQEVEWCKSKIIAGNATIERMGKNWYVTVDGSIITVNAYSFTIIAAHKIKQ